MFNSFFKKGQTAEEPKPTDPNDPVAKTGIDKFQEMMDNARKARETSQASAPQKAKPTSASSFLTKENLEALRGSVDFTKSISQETAQKIANGDATAIIEAMKSVASEAYITALQQASILTDTVATSHTSALDNDVEERIQRSIQDSKYKAAIPQFDNPIIAMGIKAFTEEARTANPGATPDEIASLVQEYVGTLNDQFNPKSEEAEGSAAKESTDWLEFATPEQENN